MSVPPELRAIGAAQIVDSKAHAKAAVGLTKEPKQCEGCWTRAKNPCRFFGADPDGDYCGHPKSLKVTSFGLSTNAMHRQGLCTFNVRELWEGCGNG